MNTTFLNTTSQTSSFEPFWIPTVVVACIVILFIYTLLRPSKKVNLPGPKGWPYPLFESIDLSNPQFTLYKWAKKYGSRFRFSFVGNEYVSLSEWESMKQVLNNRKSFEMPLYFREAITFRSGPSMFTSEGDLWKKKHHVLEPLFHNKMMKHHFNKISNKLGQLHAIIENSEEVINVVPLLHRMTIDIISAVAFGIDVETLEKPQKVYSDASGKISENLWDLFTLQHDAVSVRLSFPIKFLWNLPLPVFKKEADLFKILENLLQSAIDAHDNQKVENAQEKEFEGTDLISLLLESNVTQDDKKHFYSRQDMIGECYSIFRAGEDTTATEASFVLYNLAQNPEAQEKVREEIRSIAQSSGQTLENFEIKFDDLNKLKYVDNVIKETTRLYPTATALFREAVQAETVDGVHIPKRATVLVDVYSYYRSNIFQDANAFKPERWDDESTPQFASFGFGPRSCYGRRLAFLELRMLIVSIMQRYQLSLVPEHPLEFVNKFGMRPKDDNLRIRFRPL